MLEKRLRASNRDIEARFPLGPRLNNICRHFKSMCDRNPLLWLRSGPSVILAKQCGGSANPYQRKRLILKSQDTFHVKLLRRTTPIPRVSRMVLPALTPKKSSPKHRPRYQNRLFKPHLGLRLLLTHQCQKQCRVRQLTFLLTQMLTHTQRRRCDGAMRRILSQVVFSGLRTWCSAARRLRENGPAAGR